jgi:DNA-directed RNA polymerase specialized sigma54-like protein
MKPLVLVMLEEVELHESTVSRVTTNKYMLTPRGLFELKYFFQVMLERRQVVRHLQLRFGQ